MSIAKVLTALATGLLLVGCSGAKTAEPARTPGLTTVGNVPAAANAAEGGQVYSTIIEGLAFPPGTVNKNSSADVEIWTPPLSQTDTENYLTKTLPIGRPSAGVAWCGHSTNTATKEGHWEWSDTKKWIAVDMSGGDVAITTGDNDDSESLGRNGCEGEPEGSTWADPYQEDDFVAQLQKAGYTDVGRKTLVQAGDSVCDEFLADEDTSLIEASAALTDTYGFTEKQAQEVGAAAVENLCPEFAP